MFGRGMGKRRSLDLFLCLSFPCLFRGCSRKRRLARKWSQKNLLLLYFCPHLFAMAFPTALFSARRVAHFAHFRG
jgi:hypothetical protein